MSKKFTYGMKAENYVEKAFEKILETHPWANRDMLCKNYSYAIETEDGKKVFVKYYRWESGKVDRTVVNGDGEDFVRRIVEDNEWLVENSNPVSETFKVPFEWGTDAHGWNLERYEFRAHELGGYSSFVEAGNRSTGGSREFFIPPSFFEGSFSDFLDKYCDMVPGWSFGLYRGDLENAEGLKEFLGFKEEKNR